MSDNHRPPFFDLYKIAIETRNFEIELFWKRSNYFLVLNTVLAIGFFRLEGNEDGYILYKGFIAIIGLCVSFLWIRLIFGSKYWQIRWEEKVNELEDKLLEKSSNGGMEIAAMFSAEREERDRAVKENLLRDGKSNKGWLKEIRNCCILKKPSVSNTMLMLSILFFIAWVLLFIFMFFCN